jgi:hypothetical protein
MKELPNACNNLSHARRVWPRTQEIDPFDPGSIDIARNPDVSIVYIYPFDSAQVAQSLAAQITHFENS